MRSRQQAQRGNSHQNVQAEHSKKWADQPKVCFQRSAGTDTHCEQQEKKQRQGYGHLFRQERQEKQTASGVQKKRPVQPEIPEKEKYGTKIESATRHIRNTGDPRNGLG